MLLNNVDQLYSVRSNVDINSKGSINMAVNDVKRL